MKLQLQVAQLSDVAIIQALAYEIWNEHYVPFIGQAQVDYMLGLNFSIQKLSEKMQEDLTFYLIQEAEQTSGFLAVKAESENHFFIDKFYVQSRNKGTGSAVFRTLIAQYPDVHTIHLTVNKHNYKAINFYFKMGFCIEKTAIFDIGNNFVMDDFVMIWKRKP